MSLSHVLYVRKVESPTIVTKYSLTSQGVATTMLFALPAVRNLQPGAPPIGCVSDVAGFFFNMGIVALASVILIWRYTIQDSEIERFASPTSMELGTSLNSFEDIAKRYSVVASQKPKYQVVGRLDCLKVERN